MLDQTCEIANVESRKAEPFAMSVSVLKARWWETVKEY